MSGPTYVDALVTPGGIVVAYADPGGVLLLRYDCVGPVKRRLDGADILTTRQEVAREQVRGGLSLAMLLERAWRLHETLARPVELVADYTVVDGAGIEA